MNEHSKNFNMMFQANYDFALATCKTLGDEVIQQVKSLCETNMHVSEQYLKASSPEVQLYKDTIEALEAKNFQTIQDFPLDHKTPGLLETYWANFSEEEAASYILRQQHYVESLSALFPDQEYAYEQYISELYKRYTMLEGDELKLPKIKIEKGSSPDWNALLNFKRQM